jgi:hypothetical protein
LLTPGFLDIPGALKLSEIIIEGPSTEVDKRGIQTALHLLAEFIAVTGLFGEKAKNDELNAHKVLLSE